MAKIDTEGSVYQRKSDGRWVASVVIGTNSNGGPKRKVFYAASEPEATRLLKKFKEEQIRNGYVNVVKKDLASFLLEWLQNELSLRLKPKSYDTMEWTINKIIIPEIGHLQVGSITRDVIQSFIANISKKYAQSTVRKAYSALNQRFKQAGIDRSLVYNPAVGVVLPRRTEENTKEIRFFTAEEMQRILEAADATYPTGTKVCRLGKAVHLLYYTGMRAGEALALTWNDIDIENRMIYVNKNIVSIVNRNNDGSQPGTIAVVQKSTKTRSGQRSIPMSAKALEAIEELKAVNGGHEYVLATSSGKAMSIRAFEKMFHGCQSRAGIEPHGTLHSLRHTFASRLIENGVDVKVVSEILGHKDVTVTYNTYVHIINSVKMKAVTSLDII